MIKVTENTGYTKTLGIFIKSVKFYIGVKTIKWMILFFNQKYKFFEHDKKITGKKVRTKGKYIQTIKKRYRIFCFLIGWDRSKQYSKRYVYKYFHHKKYLQIKPGFFERLISELKIAVKGLRL